jgi:hypothetical protein
LARRTTASFVEQSPSTEMRLKVSSTEGRRKPSASPGPSGKSVVTTASIVASAGWIIPAPLAIPPTTNPAPCAMDVFGPASVVRIASDAAGPPPGESVAAASSTPLTIFSIGSRGPMTPVERTTTSSVASPSSPAVCTAVATASSSPARPVAAFATPALTTTACGSAASRWRRETTTGAAWTRFRVHSAQPTAGVSERTRATSGFPDGLIPADTPEAAKPLASVTDIRRGPPRAAGPRSPRSRTAG